MEVTKAEARELRARLRAAGIFERTEGVAWARYLGLLLVFAFGT